MTLRHKVLGSAVLSVGRYCDRVKAEKRGFDLWGNRLDCHHIPHDNTTIVPRPAGTAIAIPEDVHKEVHKLRDAKKWQEHVLTQVRNDMEIIRWRMLPRGSTEQELAEALELVHEHNGKVRYTDPETGEQKTVDLYAGTKKWAR
jgi:hypothetical protein